jgi:hypothetical protein
VTTVDTTRLGCADDLPDLAADPRVTVVYERAINVESCSVCLESGDHIEDAIGFVSFDRYGLKGCRSYLCGPEHAQDELRWLLRSRMDDVTNIVLHWPSNLAPILPSDPQGPLRPPADLVDPEDDPVFSDLRALLRYVETMPNTGADPAEASGFETARKKCVAAVASLGLKRIEHLGRAS